VINTQHVGDVTIVQVAHGKVNALDVELLDALTDCFGSLEKSEGGAVILTGAGKAFSAGVDLFRVLDGGSAYASQLIPALSRAFEAVFRFPRPVVAAVNGAAIAGGCVLACACDRRLMSDAGAPIGASELVVGVPFPAAALEVMRHACGDHTEEVILTGRLYAGGDAIAVGLIHELVAAEQLDERAREVADELSRLTPDGYRLAKQLLRGPALARMADAAANDAEVERIWASQVTAQAIRDQLEKTVARRT
jgi:enoyl-CoA hydratase/carnithine racemase